MSSTFSRIQATKNGIFYNKRMRGMGKLIGIQDRKVVRAIENKMKNITAQKCPVGK